VERAGLILGAVLLGGCAALPWTESALSPELRKDRPWGPEAADVVLLRRDTRARAEEAASGLMVAMVRFYQDVFRRSIASDCQFHPSCSNYAIEAMALYGPIQGLMMTADRLQRCHWMTGRSYPVIALKETCPRCPQLHSIYKLIDHPSSNSIAHLAPAPPRGVLARQDSPLLRRIAEAARARALTAAIDERNLFEFALDLALQSDYFRAVTELKRLLSNHSASALAADARLLTAICTIFAGREDEAVRALDSSIEADPDLDSLRIYLLAYAHFARLRFDEASRLLSAAPRTDPAWRRDCLHLNGLAHIAMGRYEEAREGADHRLAALLDRARQLPSRSPLLSGALSGVLPGTGQLICGRPGDAAAALVLTGAFGAATWEAVEEDLPIVAGLTAVVGLIFYVGNVYGGVNAAHRYNEEARLGFYREAIQSTRGDQLYWSLEEGRPGAFSTFRR
jgi:putative membrane protein insertion efficiency factor